MSESKKVSKPYTKDNLLRFINSAINHEPIDEADQYAAAIALLDFLAGHDVRKEIGTKRQRGRPGKDHILRSMGIGFANHKNEETPIWNAMLKYAAGNATEDEVVRIFKDKIQVPIDTRTVIGYIEHLLPRAKETVATLNLWRESDTTSRKKNQ